LRVVELLQYWRVKYCYGLCVKIGLIGLVEEEWIVTLSTLDPHDVRYLDLVEEGRRLAQQLKWQVIRFSFATSVRKLLLTIVMCQL